ncbi:hypothetical protein SASPL_139448 [Salvia splendens]|uniref:Disease resistance protein RPM1 n=1 Tax=Salvia splendens TaxID=180675 RepID=A0A8X8WPR3_SALSN|nr:putative disease resistance protein RGA4 [Salvia splendens]KAG6397998.1 hypothetical protein SASPL_139448 [Salvia splendens]
MADAIVSEVVGRIATMLEDKIRYEVNLVKGVKKELLNLYKKLDKIRMVLDDAEKKAMNDPIVKSWLKELENTTYEMDDILDEWNYSLLKHKLEDFAEPEPEPVQKRGCSFIPSSCLCFKDISFRRDIAKKIEHVNATLDQIYKERNEFNFVISPPATDPVPVPESQQEPTTSLIDLKNVYGLDIYKKRDDIVKNMMVNGDDTQILSIVGTGGLGKTTLAQLIFNHPHFEKDWLKIWVCVSDPFIATVVAKNIVESVGTETIPPNTNQLELVLQKVKASVSGKKFLLVLDDVWTDDNKKWEPLKISLQCGAVGSKILVTTRKETVAKMFRTLDDDMYHPNKLSEEECWSLLRDTSLQGKSEKECGKFEDVGKKIASKCNGLPLAAVVLGRLLQFKDLEGWEHVEKSEIWQLENAKLDLFPHLVLSYNELSPTLKRCFSYCAVYPKDYRIGAETLIEEWMAQGYLGSDSGNDALELKGRENLKNLAMRSLFQDIEKSESGEQIEWCKMHDIVHDFALSLRKNDDKERSCQVCDSSLVSHVQEYRSLSCIYYITPDFERDRSCKVCDCMKSVRVLRIESSRPMGMETLIHLRWLDISWITLSKDDLEIICMLYFLQSLRLSSCELTEIPQQIGSLNQLRRVDLSKNGELKQLPDSMCKLVELRTLSLESCSLEVIPQQIGNLVQLRRLDLSWNTELKELPESMGSLVELRTLSLAHCYLKEIPREIGNLVHLRRLNLSYNQVVELPDSICSLVELQTLEIEGTDINYLPQALGELSNLCTLKLCELKIGSQYNKFGFLKNLHHHLIGSLYFKIYLSSMSEMVELVEDARQEQLKTLLQKLETLELSFEVTMNETEQSSSAAMWIEVVEALVPHYKLKELAIIGYKGARLPHWMSSPLNFIKQIRLRFLSEVSSLPAMGKLPFLEFLCIESARELKMVGREFLGIESSSDVVAFPKLKKLVFMFCYEWEEWEDITEEEEEESAAISIMPCLTRLSIFWCKSLKKLPLRLLRKVSSSLLLLETRGSSELVKTYGEDGEGSALRSISQHNPQLQLLLRL